jgi:type IV secretion system protein VirD4
MKTRSKIISSVGLSIAIGILISTLYCNILDDAAFHSNRAIFLYALYYNSPMSTGYNSSLFSKCLVIIAVCAIGIPICTAIGLAMRHEHHGTARWANLGELSKAGFLRAFRRIKGPIYGKTTGPAGLGRYLCSGDHAHSLIVAPTRAGKGVGIVVPTLLTFPGSVLALDVKGELFALTSRARKAAGHTIYKFSPFDPKGRTHSFNPLLDIIAMPVVRRFSEARRLAANLIVAKGEGAEGFIAGARDLFVAGILACIERETPTIGAVYDLFAQPGEKFDLFARLARETNIPEAQRIFDNNAALDPKILTSYTSVLGDGGLNLWADPLVRAATDKSDFSIFDLRRRPSTIYLCVSPNDLEVLAPLMRLLFQQVVSILQRSLPKRNERHEVLFLLDEFKHMGKMESIETSVTTIAGYKGRFMFVVQSLSALNGTYGQAGKENFLSNTGVQVFMATADDETPNYISKAIGEYSFQAKSVSYSRAKIFDASYQVSEQGAHLIRPEQIRLIPDDTEIILFKGLPPVKCKKIKYYGDRVLKRLFEKQTGPLPEPDAVIIATAPDAIIPDSPEMAGMEVQVA